MPELKLPSAEQTEKIKDGVNVFPIRDMKVVRKYLSTMSRMVSSIGRDGCAYGVELNTKLFRSQDGMGSFEYGQQMSALAGWTGSGEVFQTYAGYVVVETKSATKTGSIWFSTKFDSGFAKVLDFDDGYTGDLGFSLYNGDQNRSVILAGEYSTNMVQVAKPRKVYASFDGGATFALIFTSTINNAAINCHIHATLFDPYDNRIYISVGDGANAGIFYSDDYGTTWKSFMPMVGGLNQQPTHMFATADRIFMLPDAQTMPGVISFKKDRKSILPTAEEFKIEVNHMLLPNVGSTAAGAFSMATHAQDGAEIYWTVPSNSTGTRPVVVVGTPDGGKTWFNVFSARNTLAKRGIVGPDKNGYYYLGCNGTATIDTFVLSPPLWSNQAYKKNITSRILRRYLAQSIANRVHGENTIAYVDESTLNSIIPFDVSEFKEKSILIQNNSTQAIATVDIYGTYGLSAGSPMFLIKNYANPALIPTGTTKLYHSKDIDLSTLNLPFLGVFIKIGFYAGGTGTYDITIVGGN